MDYTGTAKIDIDKAKAGQKVNFTITYTVGSLGIDEGGEILIARRDVCDSAIPEFNDPKNEGFIKTVSNSKVKLDVSYIPKRYIRPWTGCISIKAYDGCLEPHEKIKIKFGGEAGYRLQTFREDNHIFKIFVDAKGSGSFYPLKDHPTIRISGGDIEKLEAVVPSIIGKNTCFKILVRALDPFGNISEKYSADVNLLSQDKEYIVNVSNGTGKLSKLQICETGIHYLGIEDKKTGIKGSSNPIKCVEGIPEDHLYWGDMHGQTSETVGTGTPKAYYQFARDYAALDFSSWQGNDFQITDALWRKIIKVNKEYNEEGKFIAFLGYEWSGNYPNGGDYNIYFKGDSSSIHRSSHWQIADGPIEETDRNPISKLFKEFKDRDDVMAVPHIGGRPANLDFLDPKLVRLIEIHSHHGTFEWFYLEAIERGLKVGAVATSDDHTCRPGLSFPTKKTSRGYVSFDVKGGYTAIYSNKLSRKAIWDELMARHCYATTGERIVLGLKCGSSIMGDEIETDTCPEFEVEAIGQDYIEDTILYRGIEPIYSTFEESDKVNNKIKIELSGARSKGRNRKTDWSGIIALKGAKIIEAKALAFDQPDEGIEIVSDKEIRVKSKTSGDIDVIELDINDSDNAELEFNLNPLSFDVKVSELLKGTKVIDAGGINQSVKVCLARTDHSKKEIVSYLDKKIAEGANTYWVKVIQRNGHMAWSSPIFINYTAGNL